MIRYRRQNDTTGREAWINLHIRNQDHNFHVNGVNLQQQLRSLWYRTIRQSARAAAGRAAIAANQAATGTDLGVPAAPFAVPGQAQQAGPAGAGPAPVGVAGGAAVGQARVPAVPAAQPAPAPAQDDNADDDEAAEEEEDEEDDVDSNHLSETGETEYVAEAEAHRLINNLEAHENETRTRVADEVTRDWAAAGMGDGWEPQGAYLGEGATGVAMLYLSIQNGAIQNRAVVKDVWVDHTDWLRWTHWHGDPRDHVKREHMEIYCMQRITEENEAGSNKIVELRGFERDDSRLWYRLYMDFCPHKTLWHLVGIRDEYHYLEWIPEPCLWSFFNDLVEAFLVLEYGTSEADKRIKSWKKIVHRDVKLDNVFLDIPGAKDNFPSYPTLRLGDFGTAITTSQKDPHNPLSYNEHCGTKFWQAPEQAMYLRRNTLEPAHGRKLGEKTNVWGIGAILIRLMNTEGEPTGPAFDTLAEDGLEVYDVNARHYSEELCGLARECVSYNPHHRPTLRKLQQEILRYTTPGNDPDLAKGRRASTTDDPEDAEMEDVLNYSPEAEKYKIGLTQARLDEIREEQRVWAEEE